MNVEQKASSEIQRFLNGLSALQEVEPLLHDIGNAKQNLAEIQGKIRTCQNELTEDRERLSALREKLKSTTQDAKTAATRIVGEAETKAASIVTEAEAEIDRLVAKRFQKQLSAKDDEIAELKSKMASFKHAVEGIDG